MTCDGSSLPERYGIPINVFTDLHHQVGEYLLLGAWARDIVCGLYDLEQQMPRTGDVDIAIAVSDIGAAYRSRVAKLDGSRARSGMRYYLPNLPEVPIDVIPYGDQLPDIENIPLGGGDDRSLDATGIAEAASCAIQVRLAQDCVVNVPPLHAMIVLKLIAYELRSKFGEWKDARDLALLLSASHDTERGRDECWGYLANAPKHDFDNELRQLGPFIQGTRIRQNFGDKIRRRVVGAASLDTLPRHLRRENGPGVGAPMPDQWADSLRALTLGIREG